MILLLTIRSKHLSHFLILYLFISLILSLGLIRIVVFKPFISGSLVVELDFNIIYDP
jgi:hypothetical protein